MESKALGNRRTGSRAWCLAPQLGYLKTASAETPLHPRCSGYSVSSEESSNLSSITPGVVISGTILLLKTAEEVRILCFSLLLGLVGRSHQCCCCFGFLVRREEPCLVGKGVPYFQKVERKEEKCLELCQLGRHVAAFNRNLTTVA